MSSVDQFASVFNAATKKVFQYKPIGFNKPLVITDLDSEAAVHYTETGKQFFSMVDGPWDTLCASDFKTVKEILDQVERRKPDLIVTYRHLHSEAWRWPHSLGEHLDVLIQVTDFPVVVMPHPDREGVPDQSMQAARRIMVINDHLAGEDALINHAVCLCDPEAGHLHLTHVEDQIVFERYMEAISRIPEIDTDTARSTIQAQLLAEVSKYLESTVDILAEVRPNLEVVQYINHGRPLDTYRRIVKDHQADLVVLLGHDKDQLAMNSTAYSLAVELRTIPLLIV